MSDFVKLVNNLEYHFSFHSKTFAHFCVVNKNSNDIEFCFDYDVLNKKSIRFLDKSGLSTDQTYNIDPDAIDYLEKMFKLKAFF